MRRIPRRLVLFIVDGATGRGIIKRHCLTAKFAGKELPVRVRPMPLLEDGKPRERDAMEAGISEGEYLCTDCKVSYPAKMLNCANYDAPVNSCECGDCEPYCPTCWDNE